MSDRHDAALAALSAEQQDAVMQSYAEYREKRDRLERERRDALAAHVAEWPCCQDYNRDGALRARRLGYEWQPAVCPQCRTWSQISWMIHHGTRGYNAAEVADAA
jgi:hypothetical protein